MPGFIPGVYAEPAEIVNSQIDAMSDRADRFAQAGYQAIQMLASAGSIGLNVPPPTYALPNPDPDAMPMPAAPADQDFGTISPYNEPDFEQFDGVMAQLDAVIASISEAPEFEADFQNVVIPAPPPAIDVSGMPVQPVLNQPEIPASPVLTMPVMDTLIPVEIPAFTEPTLPTFEEGAPITFEAVAPSTVLQWTEPEYQSEVLPDIVREVRRMLAGGTGLHPAVEQALFDRDRVREDRASMRATQEAHATWAGRGFSMPPGMLVEQVNAVQEANRLETAARAREVLIKSAEWEIENLRRAVEQGIALETLLMNLHENAAKRSFDILVQRLRADVDLYNAAISAFNARQNARQIGAEVFRAKLQAALSPLEVLKARLEAERIKGQLNESLVRVYQARIDALRSVVGIFQAQVDAAKVVSDMERSKIEAFRAAVEAFSARVGAQARVFDAYEARVRAEAAKIGIIEARARAFAATIDARNSNNNAKIAAIGGKTALIQAAVTKFAAEVEAERSQIQSQATAMTARVQGFTSKVGKYSAESQALQSKYTLQSTILEGRLRNNIALHEVAMRGYDQSMNRIVEASRVEVGALQAMGSIAGQLAGGAMSAMHVQASLSGSGSASTSSSTSESHIYNHDVE